jgi:hypothetical protein
MMAAGAAGPGLLAITARTRRLDTPVNVTGTSRMTNRVRNRLRGITGGTRPFLAGTAATVLPQATLAIRRP